jgi:competence protein ComEC
VHANSGSRRIVAAALALLAGVLTVHLQAAPPPDAVVGAAALAATAGFAWRRLAWPAAYVLGLVLATLTARAIVADRLQPHLAGEVLQVTGLVVAVPIRRADGVTFELAPEPHLEPRTPSLPSRLRLAWYDGPYGPAGRPEPGERWRFSVKLRPPRGLSNPGGFDAEQRAAIDGIGATGYVHDETEPRRLAVTPAHPIERARNALARAIGEATAGSPSSGLVQALAVGVQDAVPDEQWQLFRLTGITHLVAISGLHVTLFALVVATGVRYAFRLPPLGRFVRWRVAAEVGLGLSAALAYSLLAGASVPTQRTVLMLAVYGLAKLGRRHVAPQTLLGGALIVVLLLDPLAALTAGFWLSFGAVAAILAVSVGRLRAPGLVGTFAITQAAVTVALAPPSAGLFGGLTWAGTVANVVAIPAYSFVAVPLVLLGTAFEPLLPSFAAGAWRWAAAFLDLQWPALEWLAALPGVGWSPVRPPVGWLLLGLVGALAALAPVPWHARTLATAVVAAMLAGRAERPRHGEAWVTVLDVGQGLAVVVETRSAVVLYDTGPAYPGGGSAGESVVVPYLRHRGWSRVHTLVVSHGDSDHSGGAPAIVDALPVGRRIGSAPEMPIACRAGDRWSIDAVRFEFVHPDEGRYGDNDGSCVLRVSAGAHRALLTGDITAAVEGLLPAGAVRADVVTVPHHGSRTSSSEAFVAAVQASHAVASAGHANRWKFPRAEVVQRWEVSGARVVVTAHEGAVRYVLGGRALRTAPGHRVAGARWWTSAAGDTRPMSET